MNMLFKLFFGFFKIIGRVPFMILYLFSDLHYFFIYYVFRYRREVVRQNLKNSFPGKSDKEIKKIAKRFYHNFSDLFSEAFVNEYVNKNSKKKRLSVKNMELMDEYFATQKSVIVLMGHTGNWEWVGGNIQSLLKNFKCFVAAKPLSNKIFNEMLMRLRNTYVEVVNTKYILKSMHKNRNIPSLYVLIADQRPMKHEIEYWTTFLNQDTPFFVGAEKMAKLFDFPVVFLNVKRIKRGYYEMEFTKITDHPKQTKEFEITEKYAHLLEHAIIEQPDNWLWTHKRWKHKKE